MCYRVEALVCKDEVVLNPDAYYVRSQIVAAYLFS